LLDGVPGWQAGKSWWPDVPAMRTLLSCGEKKNIAECQTDRLIFRLSDIDVAENQDVPLAALSYLSDAGEVARHYWLHADPVAFRADRDCVWLGGADLDLSDEEGMLLAAACQPVFQQFDIHLHTPSPQNWYLQLPTQPDLQTVTLAESAGQNVYDMMPVGEDAGQWRAILNEIQIILHQSDVNEKRQNEGKLPINSVWFWGGGVLPDTSSLPWDMIVSQEKYCAGLARQRNIDFYHVPEGFASLPCASSKNCLIVLPPMQQTNPDVLFDTWVAQLTELEKNWFNLILTALKAKKIKNFELYPVDGHARCMTSAIRFQFWKKTQSFEKLLMI
jgi:hypothetical protein